MTQKVLTYDEAIAKIDSIMKKFRTNEMSVDELASEVKQATELISYCKERLHKAESELKEILE